ncbi:hypothetical protein JKP88DRAFT_243738 [Tribonema minus]|uniref:Uncharacterized protein n=1 Tax=Tribonema minus TaxID=303371 RepID=A0A836CJS6_9STRA|nr:hypothetical protein JKP88DRAFT_243738 [Tribonema minus]
MGGIKTALRVLSSISLRPRTVHAAAAAHPPSPPPPTPPNNPQVAWLASKLQSFRREGAVRYARMRDALLLNDNTPPAAAARRRSQPAEHCRGDGAGRHRKNSRRRTRSPSSGSSCDAGRRRSDGEATPRQRHGGGRPRRASGGRGRSDAGSDGSGSAIDGGSGGGGGSARRSASGARHDHFDWLEAHGRRPDWAVQHGSVGQWLQDVASPMERKLLHGFVELLEKKSYVCNVDNNNCAPCFVRVQFEYNNGLDHYRYASAAELPDGAAVVNLGPTLKAAVKFFV